MDRKITALFLTLKWPSLNCQLALEFLAQTVGFTVLVGEKALFCCIGSCRNLIVSRIGTVICDSFYASFLLACFSLV